VQRVLLDAATYHFQTPTVGRRCWLTLLLTHTLVYTLLP